LINEVNVTRRIPVREERSRGWRTRVVDHETESMINVAAFTQSRVQHDGVGVMSMICILFMRAGFTPVMWKGDGSKAFRRLPVSASSLDLMWTIWSHRGCLYTSQHRGCPFGTVGASQAYHRFGSLIKFILVRIFKCPIGRYVDDYFGASREGVLLGGQVLFGIISDLFGVPSELSKNEQGQSLVLLGTHCNVDTRNWVFTAMVEEKKVIKWSYILECITLDRWCAQSVAATMAGRLSFMVTVAANKVGRAFIKPFFAEANDPWQGGRASPSLLDAAAWFRMVLLARMPVVQKSVSRRSRVVQAWTDAAGESRMIAAVVRVEDNFFFTNIRVPDFLWSQFLPRKDHYIGLQEALAVTLAVTTFASTFAGSLLTLYIDNDGVLANFIGGSSRAPETNKFVAMFWFECARLNIAVVFYRVESKANVADGPTRDRWDDLIALGAHWVEPKLPDFLEDIWAGLS
jgi:hypothetical protein